MKDQLETLIHQMYSTGILYSEALQEFRRRYITQVLIACGGNQCAAARELGMHRNTLSRQCAELEIKAAKLRDPRRFIRAQSAVLEQIRGLVG